MSKAGVAKTQGYRKTRERVDFGEKIIEGKITLGKRCLECREWKDLVQFRIHRNGLGGRMSRCKKCLSERDRRYRESNRDKYVEWRMNNKERATEMERKWREVNKERANRTRRNWRHNNPNKEALIKQRRRSRKKSLPDNFTIQQMSEVSRYFKNRCALTGETEITWEHALPLSIRHGGTIFGNMYPLSPRLNYSKQDSNIFEWFEANRQRFELSQERFDRLIEWLAAANEMTVEEYRDYVYWCHANPNDVLESEAI